MIQFVKGDILAAEAEALVNTVNCVGIMGRGIALQFKNLYPANFKAYAAACEAGEVVPGRMFVFETGQFQPKYIINFPTKRHWRGKSRMADIEAGLVALVEEVRGRNIRSIAVPPLGAGLGGLPWPEVKSSIVRAMSDLHNVRVTVFEPGGAPSAQQVAVSPRQAPAMTAGRAALIGLLKRYLDGLMDTSVSLLEAHKLMYFMQKAGQPLNLRYREAHYGPYAENLRHVFRDIEGYMISGYLDGGDDPRKELTLIVGAVEEAERALSGDFSTRERFDRVASLVDGFESPYGLELLATVHWVAEACPDCTAAQVIDRVHSWNERKRIFTPRQIGTALDTLRQKGWLPEGSEKAVVQ